MQITWNITTEDTAKVKSFVEKYQDDLFVKERIRKNLATEKPPVTKETFWYWLVACLLTTQQRSGPNSAINQFLTTKPFPLGLDNCNSANKLAAFAEGTIKNFGGIRRGTTIGRELQKNLQWLDNEGWEPTLSHLDQLRESDDRLLERTVAEFIDENLAGFGPKQSRNLLQALGLTRYETPIDSRITKWLNAFGFPVRLSAGALSDRHYYEFISDGFQELCKEAGVYPCVLDAAIFTSYDDGGWTEDILVW